MTINGVRVTLRNAEQLVKRYYPRACCSSQRTNAGDRYYLVHLRGGEPGELWSGNGKSKGAAWREAAEHLAARNP